MSYETNPSSITVLLIVSDVVAVLTLLESVVRTVRITESMIPDCDVIAVVTFRFAATVSKSSRGTICHRPTMITMLCRKMESQLAVRAAPATAGEYGVVMAAKAWHRERIGASDLCI